MSFDAINTGISTALGSIYVNDDPNDGRLQRVVVQADAPSRMQPDDLLKLNAVNSKGQAVPLSAFAVTRWITGPMQTVRYNGYPSMRITGDATPGHSTGEAIAEMERLATQLPPGFAYEWTGQSREEKLAGATVFILLGFSMPRCSLRSPPCMRAGRSPCPCCWWCPWVCLAQCWPSPCADFHRRLLQGRSDYDYRPRAPRTRC